MQFKQAAHFARQVSIADTFDRSALGLLPILIEKDQAAVGRIEGNLHFVFGPGLLEAIVLLAQGHDRDVAGFAEPLALAQVGIDAFDNEQRRFLRRRIRTAGHSRLRMCAQRRQVSGAATGQLAIQEVAAGLYRLPQRLPIGKGLTGQHLLIPGLVTALRDRPVTGLVGRSDDQVDAQAQQEQMQLGRKWRLAGVIKVDAVAIYPQLARQTPLPEGEPEH